jgi:flagellar biogenesis protein FliO
VPQAARWLEVGTPTASATRCAIAAELGWLFGFLAVVVAQSLLLLTLLIDRVPGLAGQAGQAVIARQKIGGKQRVFPNATNWGLAMHCA